MPEESATASSSSSVEEKPSSSTSAGAADSSGDVIEEAKKLIGSGNKHLVMGDVVSAVSVFQDACSLLAAKYGDTADECGEAFFLCGKSLLELARMENSVLGNALEGVPEESEDDEQPDGSNIESANNLDEKTRDELRQQVYEAMAEPEKAEDANHELSKNKAGDAELESKNGKIGVEECENGVGKSPVKLQVNGSHKPTLLPNKSSDKKAEEENSGAAVNGQGGQNGNKEGGPHGETEKNPEKEDEDGDAEDGEESEGSRCLVQSTLCGGEHQKVIHYQATFTGVAEDDDDDDDDEDGETNGQEKEEEVGNLQLAWEMLEVAKVIYKRKEGKEDQLMAAQTYLKLGEVSAESGNYPQALEDFQDCLTLQLKLLPSHSRLLAETHYHVATTLCYMEQYGLAIQHYNSSITVIQDRLAMLEKAIASADSAGTEPEEKSELEELKQLLPDIKEKVEDAKESQRTGRAASNAIQHTLGGASTSSAFMCENGGASSSSAFPAASQVPLRTPVSTSSSTAASDISHLVRKKRKPEDEHPLTDTDAKQAKQEATLNGSTNSSASNGVTEAQSQESAGSSA